MRKREQLTVTTKVDNPNGTPSFFGDFGHAQLDVFSSGAGSTAFFLSQFCRHPISMLRSRSPAIFKPPGGE
jgi:hypothetical protein